MKIIKIKLNCRGSQKKTARAKATFLRGGEENARRGNKTIYDPLNITGGHTVSGSQGRKEGRRRPTEPRVLKESNEQTDEGAQEEQRKLKSTKERKEISLGGRLDSTRLERNKT